MASSSRYLGRDPLQEEEALEAIYRDIIGNLMICPDHRPEGVLSVPHSSFVSLMNPQLMKSEHMISLVRDRLDQQLSGNNEANTNIRYITHAYSLVIITVIDNLFKMYFFRFLNSQAEAGQVVLHQDSQEEIVGSRRHLGFL